MTHRCSWFDTMTLSFASPAKCAFQSFRVVQEKRHRSCCTGQAVAILCHLAQSAYVRREAQLEPTPRSPSLGLGSGSLAVPTILCCLFDGGHGCENTLCCLTTMEEFEQRPHDKGNTLALSLRTSRFTDPFSCSVPCSSSCPPTRVRPVTLRA